MKQIDTTLLRRLSAEAAESPRRRKNYNLHPALEDPVQRLLNAIEPGTYVRPHRHPQPEKWELLAILSGHAVLLTFDDDGRVRERLELEATGPLRLAELPANTWHTLVAVAPATVLLEVKQGPYLPPAPHDFAEWAPPEGDPACETLERWFGRARAGECWAKNS